MRIYVLERRAEHTSLMIHRERLAVCLAFRNYFLNYIGFTVD
jgi:hypothetical protein